MCVRVCVCVDNCTYLTAFYFEFYTLCVSSLSKSLPPLSPTLSPSHSHSLPLPLPQPLPPFGLIVVVQPQEFHAQQVRRTYAEAIEVIEEFKLSSAQVCCLTLLFKLASLLPKSFVLAQKKALRCVCKSMAASKRIKIKNKIPIQNQFQGAQQKDKDRECFH